MNIGEAIIRELNNGLPLYKVADKIKDDPLILSSFCSAYSAELIRQFFEEKYKIRLDALRRTSLQLPPVVEKEVDGKVVRAPAFATYIGGGMGGRPVCVAGPVGIEIKIDYKSGCDSAPIFSGEIYVPLRPSRFDIIEGVNYGSKLIRDMSKYGDNQIHVFVEEFARTARSPVLEFEDIETAKKAKSKIKALEPKIKSVGDEMMKEVKGSLSEIEIYQVGREIFVNLIYEMCGAFYGHEKLTRSTDAILEKVISPELTADSYKHDVLMLAGGIDGDLRPGERNARGRKSSAYIKIPGEYLSKITNGATARRMEKLNIIKYWKGNVILGTYTHTGMELEILDAYFNAIEPPTPPFVSSYIDVHLDTTEEGDLFFEVQCKNFEMGVMFEGPVSETGMECRSILGIDKEDYDSMIKAVGIGTAVLIPGGLNQHRLMEVGGLGKTKSKKVIL